MHRSECPQSPRGSDAAEGSGRPFNRPPLRGYVSNYSDATDIKDPVAEFRELMAKFGFVVEYLGIDELKGHFLERDDLRKVELRPEVDVTAALTSVSVSGERSGQAGRPLWVGEEICSLFNRLPPPMGLRCFVGGSSEELLSLMAGVHPATGRCPPSRLTMDAVRGVYGTAARLEATPALLGPMTLYLADSLVVTLEEKFLLAAETGSLEVLEAVLCQQAGKKEAIDDVVENKPLYDRIAAAPHGARTMQRMLEHTTKCNQRRYMEDSHDRYQEMRRALLEPCAAVLDFSKEGSWRDGGRHSRDSICVRLNGENFYASKWWLSSSSRVFERLCFGGFAEGGAELPTVPLEDDVGRAGLVRFLSLLHPSHGAFLWRLLPEEYVLHRPSRNAALADIWRLLFDSNFDVAFDVFRLAHKFEVLGLMELCVVVMEVETELSVGEWLKLADSYHLPPLLARCLAQLHSPRAVKRMMSEESTRLHAELSCPMHSLLFEHLLNLS